MQDGRRRHRNSKRTEEYKKEAGKVESPCLFFLHILVAVILTTKIAGVVREDTPFIVASRGTFTDMFLRDAVTREGNVGYLYEINQVIASVNRSIHSFYMLPSVGLDVYDALTKPVTITATLMRVNPRNVLPKKEKWRSAHGGYSYFLGDLGTRVIQVNVTSKDDNWLALLGNNSTLTTRAFFNSLVQLEMVFKVRTLHREMDHVQLFDWDVRANYGFITRGGRIELSLAAKGSHVHLDTGLHWELVMDVFLGILALISEFVAFHSGHGLIVYWGGKRNWFNSDIWDIVTAATDICIFAFIVLEFGDYLGFNHENRYLITSIAGVACMLAWSKIIENLEPIQPYRTLILAMRRGVPVVAKFVVGSAPLLMGFAGLGMALFSEHSDKFASLENSVITLFSILNGDVLLETAKEIRPAGIVGDLFLVAFVCIFVYSGLNVFISIIQDAYAAAKEQAGAPPGVMRPSRGSVPDLRLWDAPSLEAPATARPVSADTGQGHVLSSSDLRLLLERLASLDEQVSEIRKLQSEMVAATWQSGGGLWAPTPRGSGDIGLGSSPVSKVEVGRFLPTTTGVQGGMEQGGPNSHLQYRFSHQRNAIGATSGTSGPINAVSSTQGMPAGGGLQRQNSFGSLSRAAHTFKAGIVSTGVTSPPDSLSPRHKIL